MLSLIAGLCGCQLDVRLRVDRLGPGRVALIAVDGGGGPDHCIESVVIYGRSSELVWGTRRHPSAECQNRIVVGEAPHGYLTNTSERLEPGKTYSALVSGGGYALSTYFTL